jgi:hypothetical protein
MSDESLGIEPVTAEQRDQLEASPEASAEMELFNASQRCFNNHRIASLKHSKTLLAAMGTVTADLLEVQALVALAVRNQLRLTPGSVEEVGKVTPLIDMQVRLARQIAQLSQIESRESKPDSPDH